VPTAGTAGVRKKSRGRGLPLSCQIPELFRIVSEFVGQFVAEFYGKMKLCNEMNNYTKIRLDDIVSSNLILL